MLFLKFRSMNQVSGWLRFIIEKLLKDYLLNLPFISNFDIVLNFIQRKGRPAVMNPIKNKISRIASITLLLLTLWVNLALGQSVYVGKTGAQGKVLKKYIEPLELKKLTENPVDSIWIIDVRSEKAFLSGHIPTAKSFPAGIVMNRISEIPKSKYLIIYCTVGANAQIVSKKLRKTGYRRYINWGGISRWEWEQTAKYGINVDK